VTFTQFTAGATACAVLVCGTGGDSRLVTVTQKAGNRAARSPRIVDVSANGQFIAFQSWARLVPADLDDEPDIYVFDRSTGRVTFESADAGIDTENAHPRISGDGRLVVFESRLTSEEQRPRIDILLRDRDRQTTRKLTGGIHQGNTYEWSRAPDISDDGRFVAFSSVATTLVPGVDMNGALEDVYIVELATGAIARASVNSRGAQLSTGNSILPALTTDGSAVAFASTARLDDEPHATAAALPSRQVYVRNLKTGTTTRVSRAARGGLPDGDSSLPTISGDGRFIAYVSEAANISSSDNNRGADVYLFDLDTNTTTLVSRAESGVANGISSSAVISGDGRFVAYQSDAGNLVCGSRCSRAEEDINLVWDVFVWDRATGRTARVSEDELGGWMEWSTGPALDRAGEVIAFSSRHPTDTSDRLDDLDLFIRVRPSAAGTAARK
jgi:Tol biopolymer transport system component